ncbi:MAG: tryptophan synthase subunit alpha [Actinobacteria bacterium]|jgi:tryptophan synthase alpha chain|uniref:tryptophan synthase n=1 Tax=freshwater metagenome TaxID=449393 RepID=A0A6J6FA01_9ZZZZ|nr:tryptophan synthase subunit alpha [Actinomycetota bacterium]
MTALDELFVKVRAENRAALIAYIPAGFPSQSGCHKVIEAFIAGGVDAIEIGFPYSDPVMDGPTIQDAAVTALANGTGATEVFQALATASAHVPAVVMTYWNPIERYGVDKFAAAISANGGSGVITPDLTIEESQGWASATVSSSINPIYVVAPSTSDSRLSQVTSKCGGFVYAASLMGVTGARTTVSSGAADLVERVRKTTTLPVAVGLGVSTREQAKGVAAYADGVIVGSAFIKAMQDAPDEASGLAAVKELAIELAKGVREGR